jgi:uncharacterized membrane protein
MPLLIGATILLIASHLLPSAPGVRESLIARLGRGGFYAWYSLLSLLALGFVLWLIGLPRPGRSCMRRPL